MVGEAYHQGLIHYHVGEIAEHLEQMAIGLDASDYRPSNDEGEAYCQDLNQNQESVRSNGTAVCNHAEGTMRHSSTVSTAVLINAAGTSATLSPAATTAATAEKTCVVPKCKNCNRRTMSKFFLVHEAFQREIEART